MDRIPAMLRNGLLAFGILAWATFAQADAIGTVDFVTGHVTLTRPGVRQVPQEGVKILEGDAILTESDGEVHLDMVDGAALSVRPGSSVTITKYGLAEDDNILISLSKGALRSVTGWFGHLRSSRYAVKTPTATIGIRGTDHETTYEPDGESAGTYERVFEGGTFVQDAFGKTVDATPGIAVAWDREGNGFRNVGERELPGFILQRARHDDRFEKRFSQRSGQRIRERLSHHLSELGKRDPAAASRLRQHINEKFPDFRGANKLRNNAAESRSGISKPDNAGREKPQRQAENRQRTKERRRQQPAQRRQQRLEQLKQEHANSASTSKRGLKRKPWQTD